MATNTQVCLPVEYCRGVSFGQAAIRRCAVQHRVAAQGAANLLLAEARAAKLQQSRKRTCIASQVMVFMHGQFQARHDVTTLSLNLSILGLQFLSLEREIISQEKLSMSPQASPPGPPALAATASLGQSVLADAAHCCKLHSGSRHSGRSGTPTG